MSYQVNGALLCIYNCEMLRRSSLSQDDRKNKMLKFVDSNDVQALKQLYSIGRPPVVESTAASSSSSSSGGGGGHRRTGSILPSLTFGANTTKALTPSALTMHNRMMTAGNDNDETDDAELALYRPDYLEIAFKQEIRHENIERILRVVLQVFHSNLSHFKPYTLSHFVRVVHALTSSGMPYSTPSHADLCFGEKNRKTTIVIKPTADSPIDIGHKANDLGVGSPTQTVDIGNLQLIESTLSSDEIVTEGSAADVDMSQAPRVVVKTRQKSLADRLDEFIKSKAMSSSQDLYSNIPRASIAPSVLVEMLSCIKSCIYRSKNNRLEYQLQSQEALYSVHMRALYDQQEQVLVMSNSMLQLLD